MSRFYHSFLATWKCGQTFVTRVRDRHTGRDRFGDDLVLTVTNDGENWVAFLGVLEDERVPQPEGKPDYRGSIGKLEPEFRMPLQWARKTVKNPYTKYSTLAAKIGATETLPYESPATKDLGSASYTGFDKYKKRSAHSLESLHRAVNAAVLQARKSWGWDCAGLEVKFHEHWSSRGLAYMPGTGAQTGIRKISLGVELLEEYDLNAIARVVIHELCHHYREEKWPRTAKALGIDPHDDLFCRALAEADPESKDKKTCTFFTEAQDPALTAVKNTRLESRGIQPVWSPDAGRFELYRLKSGELRLEWKPIGLEFNWSRWVRPVNQGNVIDILKRFGYVDWNSVRVDTVGGNFGRFVDRSTLLVVAVDLVKTFKMTRVQAFLAESMEANKV